MRFALLSAFLLAPHVGAQVIRPGGYAAPVPEAWTALSVGLFQSQPVHDGTTSSVWAFGTGALQYRATLEKTIQNQSSIGIAATFAQVPLTYQSDVLAAGCGSCDASANITQIFATFHSGANTVGFHQVIDLQLGATIYSNFRRADNGAKLPPTNADPDLAFSFGYGFGFALSQRMQIEVVEELATSIHQRTGLAAGENTTPRQYVTRVGVRFGLGG